MTKIGTPEFYIYVKNSCLKIFFKNVILVFYQGSKVIIMKNFGDYETNQIRLVFKGFKD